MRNYALWQWVGLAFAASGLLAIGAAFVASGPGVSNDVRGGLAVYGFAALILGGVGALWARTRIRIDAAQRTGGDVQAAAQGDPRWRGGALAALGVALLAIVWAIVNATLPQLAWPGRTIAGTRFTGSAQDARGILMLYVALGGVAVGAIVYGTWMMRTGRQSRTVVTVATALLALLLAAVAALTSG